MLLVQEYLLNHTFADLEIEHGIYASFNKTGNLFSLNYDMIEAKDDDLLAQECRGLILSNVDGSSFLAEAKQENGKTTYKHICPGDTRIVCFGMKRFFNLGQGEANIDWNDPQLSITTKMDGSLIQVYSSPFTDVWNVATRSVPEADLKMDNGIHTFRSLFERALFDTCGKTFDAFVQTLDKNITYCFELCSPLNQIVVRYSDYRITLLAARDLTNLQELDITTLPMLPEIPRVQSYAPCSVDELVAWVNTFDPLQNEGVVVRDSQFNRVKIKSAQYVLFSKCRDALSNSPRNCLEIILSGKEDDIITFLPQEIANNLISIKQKYKLWLKEEERMYKKVFDEAFTICPNDKKTFALTLNKYITSFKPAFFAIFDGKANSVKDFIEKNSKEGTWSNSFLDRILSII